MRLDVGAPAMSDIGVKLVMTGLYTAVIESVTQSLRKAVLASNLIKFAECAYGQRWIDSIDSADLRKLNADSLPFLVGNRMLTIGETGDTLRG